MLDYLDDDIKKDYIEWVKYIYDDYNDSILSNEKLFVAFVEDTMNTALHNYFKNDKNKIKIYKDGDINDGYFYYCKYYYNGYKSKFNNGNYVYTISSYKLFKDAYYYIIDLISDLPF